MSNTVEIMKQVQAFVTEKPVRPGVAVPSLRETFAATRQIGVNSASVLESDQLSRLEGIKPVSGFDDWRTMVQNVFIPETNQPYYNGTGEVFSINTVTGEMRFSRTCGPIHQLTDKDGHPYFASGLASYAVSKAVLEAGLRHAGRRGGMARQENIDWLQNITGVENLHLGGFTGKNRYGELVCYGVSGAELTPRAVTYLKSILRPESTDGDFTGAGLADYRAGAWTFLLTENYQLTSTLAQSQVKKDIDLMRRLDAAGGVPGHFH